MQLQNSDDEQPHPHGQPVKTTNRNTISTAIITITICAGDIGEVCFKKSKYIYIYIYVQT
jgi:hypothetical protein